MDNPFLAAALVTLFRADAQRFAVNNPAQLDHIVVLLEQGPFGDLLLADLLQRPDAIAAQFPEESRPAVLFLSAALGRFNEFQGPLPDGRPASRITVREFIQETRCQIAVLQPLAAGLQEGDFGGNLQGLLHRTFEGDPTLLICNPLFSRFFARRGVGSPERMQAFNEFCRQHATLRLGDLPRDSDGCHRVIAGLYDDVRGALGYLRQFTHGHRFGLMESAAVIDDAVGTSLENSRLQLRDLIQLALFLQTAVPEPRDLPGSVEDTPNVFGLVLLQAKVIHLLHQESPMRATSCTQYLGVIGTAVLGDALLSREELLPQRARQALELLVETADPGEAVARWLQSRSDEQVAAFFKTLVASQRRRPRGMPSPSSVLQQSIFLLNLMENAPQVGLPLGGVYLANRPVAFHRGWMQGALEGHASGTGGLARHAQALVDQMQPQMRGQWQGGWLRARAALQELEAAGRMPGQAAEMLGLTLTEAQADAVIGLRTLCLDPRAFPTRQALIDHLMQNGTFTRAQAEDIIHFFQREGQIPRSLSHVPSPVPGGTPAPPRPGNARPAPGGQTGGVRPPPAGGVQPGVARPSPYPPAQPTVPQWLAGSGLESSATFFRSLSPEVRAALSALRADPVLGPRVLGLVRACQQSPELVAFVRALPPGQAEAALRALVGRGEVGALLLELRALPAAPQRTAFLQSLAAGAAPGMGLSVRRMLHTGANVLVTEVAFEHLVRNMELFEDQAERQRHLQTCRKRLEQELLEAFPLEHYAQNGNVFTHRRSGIPLDVTRLRDISDDQLARGTRDLWITGGTVTHGVLGAVMALSGSSGVALPFVVIGAAIVSFVRDELDASRREALRDFFLQTPPQILALAEPESATRLAPHDLLYALQRRYRGTLGLHQPTHTAEETDESLRRCSFALLYRELLRVSPIDPPLLVAGGNLQGRLWEERETIGHLLRCVAGIGDAEAAQREMRLVAIDVLQMLLYVEYHRARVQLDRHEGAAEGSPNRLGLEDEVRLRGHILLLGNQRVGEGFAVCEWRPRTIYAARATAPANLQLRDFEELGQGRPAAEDLYRHPHSREVERTVVDFLRAQGAVGVVTRLSPNGQSREAIEHTQPQASTWQGVDAYRVRRGSTDVFVTILGGQLFASAPTQPRWQSIRAFRLPAAGGGAELNGLLEALARMSVSLEDPPAARRVEAVAHTSMLRGATYEDGRYALTIGTETMHFATWGRLWFWKRPSEATWQPIDVFPAPQAADAWRMARRAEFLRREGRGWQTFDAGCRFLEQRGAVLQASDGNFCFAVAGGPSSATSRRSGGSGGSARCPGSALAETV